MVQAPVLLNVLSSKFFHPKGRTAFMRSVGNFASEIDFATDPFVKSQIKIVDVVLPATVSKK